MDEGGEPAGGLYSKYRVFREPQEDDARNPVTEHPVHLHPPSFDTPTKDPKWMMSTPLEEVEGFVFVLKPDNDPHARVAIAAYAWSVKGEDPALWGDLMNVLAEWIDD